MLIQAFSLSDRSGSNQFAANLAATNPTIVAAAPPGTRAATASSEPAEKLNAIR
jgi:hypothetical protein